MSKSSEIFNKIEYISAEFHFCADKKKASNWWKTNLAGYFWYDEFENDKLATLKHVIFKLVTPKKRGLSNPPKNMK